MIKAWLLGLVLGGIGPAQATPETAPPFDWAELKKGWRGRIEQVVKKGGLPVIDVESTFNSATINPKRFARIMDEEGITLMVMSPELFGGEVDQYSARWPRDAHWLAAEAPAHFIPAPNADLERVLYRELDPFRYLDHLFSEVLRERYPMMGEFMLVSYASDSGYALNPNSRTDIVGITANGMLAEKIFAFSERHGVAIQIHFEIEDSLLPSLENLLTRHPGAKVIWCHLGRVRLPARARAYGPDYVRKLIEKYPNLFFDLPGKGSAVTFPDSTFLWDAKTERLKDDWARLIADHPWRFVIGVDIGGDRMAIPRIFFRKSLAVLNSLPKETREIVAYKAAWKLLFGEEL